MRGERQLKIRFFLSLTLIAACSVLVLASALFVWFRAKTIDNVNAANESVLLNTETVLDKYIDTAQNYTMDFYRNPNINMVMQSEDNGWSDQLYGALSQIRGTLTVNPYLENAYIMGKDEPALMFENNPLSPDAKRELFERIRGSVIKQSPFMWTATMNDGKPSALLTVFYNDRAFDSSEYAGAIAITVNLQKLQRNLFTSSEDGDTRYAVLDAAGSVLMQNGPADSGFDPDLLGTIAGGTAKAGTLVWDSDRDGRKLITYRQADRGGLWLLSETPYENSVRDIASALKLLVWLCLSLMAAAAIIAALVSHRMYKPIGTLFGAIRSLSGERLGFASGIGGGGFAGGGGGFAEANRELERIAGRFGELARENEDSALLNWLTSPYRSDDRLPSALPPLRNAEGPASFRVAVLRLIRSEEDDGMTSDALRERMRGLPRLTEELFEETVTCRGFFPHGEAAVLILSERETGSFGDDGQSRPRWELLEQRIRSWPVKACTIGVSRLSADSGELKRLYEEANGSLQHAKFQYRASVLFAEDAGGLGDGPVPDGLAEAVLQVVRSREQELIPRAVERLLAAMAEFKAEPASVALARLASDLRRIAETGLAEASARQTDFLEHYQRIWRIENYEELRDWLERLCSDACERLKELNATHTRQAAGEAIDYIRKNYGDPTLSLNGLAERLALSPPYLSRLITEATGSSFPDFVNLVRLDHARVLLAEEKELDIREIAEKSGYNSSTYFTTLFKKRYGVTPSKWRLNHILQRESEAASPR